MAPLELYQKIWVKSSFLDTDMGEIACEDCHGGDPKDPNWQTAHNGILKDPTFPEADEACGECHEDIVSTAKNSLHYTLAPFGRVIKARANKKDKRILEKIHQAKEKHCNHCHASCGQCHVSRPDYVKGGFLDKHHFKKTPPMETTCAACHGGRVYEEFTGLKDEYSAFIRGHQVYYNFIRPHQSLFDKTPAEIANINLGLKDKKWENLLFQSIFNT